ncbi:MAG TPA: hypothetical protein VGP12_02870 [Nitrosospira sp.]|jgi:hypothetical protein|nr:hypothetical protein [Nitrosospira sp.]
MKRRLFILLTLGLTCVPGFAYAQNVLDAERVSAIGQHCTLIQTTLDQLQRRDLVARTNRGRSYEAQLKQIDALAKRFKANNLSTQTMDAPAVAFRSSVDSFRTAYVAYDDRMTTLRQIDCRTKPEDFATALEELRVMRQEVGAEVTKGDEALAQYRQAIVDLRPTVPEAKGSAQ